MKADDEAGRVRANRRFIEQAGIWHLISTNPEVRSCREAAEHRWRLGGRGIPLCDELKSSIGVLEGARSPYVAIHCRGHQYVDEDKLEALLGGTFRRLEEDELSNVFDMAYGIVTPFGLVDRPEVIQVFDRTVLERYFPPFTMMTNLGSRTTAVEFDPRQLLGVLANVQVADVVRDSDLRVPKQHTVGILTGNGPESGMLLWECMNDYIRSSGDRRFRGDLAFPHVLVESLPGMGLSMELSVRADEVRPVVLDGVARLCAAGATIVGIACNTTQYFAHEIMDVCETHGAHFVSLVDVTAERLAHDGVSEFDFFGISAVTDFDGWSAFTRLYEDFKLVRPSDSDLEKINEVAFSVKQRGVDGRAVNRLRDLIGGASRTETVVIALTELSTVLHRHPKNKGGKKVIDTLEVLAEAMAAIYLQERSVIDVPDCRGQRTFTALGAEETRS